MITPALSERIQEPLQNLLNDEFGAEVEFVKIEATSEHPITLTAHISQEDGEFEDTIELNETWLY